MVGQNKNRCLIGWRVSPPTLPGIIHPRSAERPKHVAAEDPGTDVVERMDGKIIVDTQAAAGLPMHLVKDLGLLKPGMQLETANAQRILQILQRPRAKSIQRNRKYADFNFAHFKILLLSSNSYSA